MNATSSTCLDHFITSFQTETQTIPTTISDHFSVLGEIPLSTDGIKCKPYFRKTRDLRGIKGENALKFPFLLDQKPKQNYTGRRKSHDRDECVDRFARETFIKSQNNGNDWVTNKVKNAVTKRDEFLHKWVSNPSYFNRETYKKQRNLVTSVIGKFQ